MNNDKTKIYQATAARLQEADAADDELQQMRRRMERRQEAMGRMTADLQWLIGQPSGSLTWTGTQRDLVEMVHLVWMRNAVTDRQGRPCTQNELARRAFRAVGRPVPPSLPRIVSRVQNRVTAGLSMVERYERLAGQGCTIAHFVQHNNPTQP